MLEIWLIEIAKGIGKIFLNPLLYWALILFILTGNKRIKKERYNFGTKIFHLFAERRNTLFISIISSITISLLAIFSGIVISFEIMVLLMVVTILLSITGATSFLSASYTIGFTFILLIILPFVNDYIVNPYVDFGHISTVYLIGLTILLAMFLLIESIILSLLTDKTAFPNVVLSQRGIWIGEQQLKRLAFIPFFVFMPTDSVSIIAPILPYFQVGEQSFSLVLLPFIVGFHYNVRGSLPSVAAKRIGKATFWLSIIVLLGAFASLYIPGLTIASIIIAILGREWITYRHKINERKQPAFFSPLDNGVKVLAMIPDSPADRLGILVGETILKVNGVVVTNSTEFYGALQASGAYFKLDVIDENGEVRFINSAFFEEDHYELGIIFAEKPHQL